ncbi:MAG: hypothetical protein L0228_15115 [Planctomycetes bacterium]|nr:hypothetical protein [Planctomycetota bacterium]
MNRKSIVRALIVALLLTANASAQTPSDESEAVTIPLEEIWAYGMPGTRKIEDIARLSDMRSLGPIFESWFNRSEKMKFKDVARAGFAVSGSDVSALRAALAVFSEKEKPQKRFSSEDKVTIVFFSEPCGGNHVRIEQVERVDNHIEIQYWLEPYFERTLSQTFALIPLGKLPPARYDVEMRQLPRDHKYIRLGLNPTDEDWSAKVLCKPFKFVMADKRE